MTDRIPMTPEGYKALEEEIKRLRREERPKIVKDLAEAMAHGDLAENSEYDDAKERQGILEKKIRELEDRLARAVIIERQTHGTVEEVTFGVTVRLREEATGREVTYRIVGEGEAEVSNGKISISSPLARALVGHKVGDTVEFRAPAGIKIFDILDIQP